MWARSSALAGNTSLSDAAMREAPRAESAPPTRTKHRALRLPTDQVGKQVLSTAGAYGSLGRTTIFSIELTQTNCILPGIRWRKRTNDEVAGGTSHSLSRCH